MSKIVKNTLLNYVPKIFQTENIINFNRIFKFNNYEIKSGQIIYFCERELRLNDNFALQFAIQKSEELNLPLKILHSRRKYRHFPKRRFIDVQLERTQNLFLSMDFDFDIIYDEQLLNYLFSNKVAILIIDFNPVLNYSWLKNMPCKIYEIDGHNIIPARFVSDKQEYNAATLRRKIYNNIPLFLTEYDRIVSVKTEADFVLEDFIINKLPYYAEFKNDPTKDVVSGLSKYMNFGFISSQRVALEVLKSDATNDNKEAFLEELIVRKELADNFCLYSRNFKTLNNIPLWAKKSLEFHKFDIRPYLYSLQELEKAKTHDKLWNATQMQLLYEGAIHGYLRMYWAKKILEWTKSPEEALNFAIYLNDKYAYDAPSTNGYVGILWAIGALHDRAFRDYPVTGKIRRMTYDSIKSKYNIQKYIDKYTF